MSRLNVQFRHGVNFWGKFYLLTMEETTKIANIRTLKTFSPHGRSRYAEIHVSSLRQISDPLTKGIKLTVCFKLTVYTNKTIQLQKLVLHFTKQRSYQIYLIYCKIYSSIWDNS